MGRAALNDRNVKPFELPKLPDLPASAPTSQTADGWTGVRINTTAACGVADQSDRLLITAGALVETMRRAGLEVTERTDGDPYGLPQIADLAAFRVVQESLTNALKHGAGSAELVVDYTATAVVLEIRNPVPEQASSAGGSGHGLVGMRERVTAVGGRFTAGPGPAGWFTVRAEIPREGTP